MKRIRFLECLTSYLHYIFYCVPFPPNAGFDPIPEMETPSLSSFVSRLPANLSTAICSLSYCRAERSQEAGAGGFRLISTKALIENQHPSG